MRFPVFARGVRVLRLKPGDALLVETAHKVSSDQGNRIFCNLNGAFPGHSVLICDDGIRIRPLRALAEGKKEKEESP